MVFDTAQREFPLKSRIFAALSGQQDLAISPRSGALDSPDEVWPYTTHTNFDASKASTLSEPICLSQLSIQSAVRQLIPLNPLQIWITRAAGTSPPVRVAPHNLAQNRTNTSKFNLRQHLRLLRQRLCRTPNTSV